MEFTILRRNNKWGLGSIMAENSKKPICLREFIHKAVALPNDEFEMAMRLENNDEDINNIKIIAQPLDSYDRN